jgi:RNA polymerase sigma-70 factor (ECF subfamily)
LAYRITLSRKDAEDIVQDVFLKLYYKLHQFEEKSKISTWIYRIALNTSIDSQRRFKKWKEGKPLHLITEKEMNIPKQNPDEHNTTEIPELLNRAIAKLKRPFRAVLILRNFEDFSYEDIAEILHITSGTVASRLNRAYTKLKIELEKLGIDKQYLMNQ